MKLPVSPMFLSSDAVDVLGVLKQYPLNEWSQGKIAEVLRTFYNDRGRHLSTANARKKTSRGLRRLESGQVVVHEGRLWHLNLEPEIVGPVEMELAEALLRQLLVFHARGEADLQLEDSEGASINLIWATPRRFVRSKMDSDGIQEFRTLARKFLKRHPDCRDAILVTTLREVYDRRTGSAPLAVLVFAKGLIGVVMEYMSPLPPSDGIASPNSRRSPVDG